MTRLDHLLWILAEECDEVGQRASKAARFGLDEIQPGQELNNAERIMTEYADILGAVELLLAEGAIEYPPNFEEMVTAKKDRIEKYLGRSKLCGRLD